MSLTGQVGRSGQRRRAFPVPLLGALIALLGCPAPAQPVPEYEVKAAYLLNFARFTEWPEEEARSGEPITLCVVGDDPFGRVLDQVVEGETVGNRKLAVQRIRPGAEAACNIAFVSKTVKDPKALSALPHRVLTVGESPSFLRDGGMIAFAVENRRVRFDINATAVRQAGLRLSSRLLTVARTVEK